MDFSPTSKPSYDDDLSTLTQIRISNRKAKERLVNRALADSTNYGLNGSSSPSKKYSPPKKTARDLTYDGIRSTRSALPGNENEKLLNESLYTLDRRLNDLKRQRYMDNIKSPYPSPIKGMKSQKPYGNSAYREKEYELKSDSIGASQALKLESTPNLQPDYKIGNSLTTNDDIFNSFRNLDLKKRDNDTLNRSIKEKNQIDDINRLRLKIDKLESKLESYKNNRQFNTIKDKDFVSENNRLQNEVDELKKFINFLEFNFDKVYIESRRYKQNNANLLRENQKLISASSYHNNQRDGFGVNVEESEAVGEPLDGLTTSHLLRFDEPSSKTG